MCDVYNKLLGEIYFTRGIMWMMYIGVYFNTRIDMVSALIIVLCVIASAHNLIEFSKTLKKENE